MLFSVLCKHAATSALIVIALWIYLTVFSSMVASVVANLCYPLDGIQGYYNTLSNYELQAGAGALFALLPLLRGGDHAFGPGRAPSSASPPRTPSPGRCRERSPSSRARCSCGRIW